MTTEHIRAVVADDSVLLRDGLVRLLTDDGIDVVAAVGDADALLDAVTEHEPDLCLVDVRMPPTHTDEGLRAAVEIRRRHPSTWRSDTPENSWRATCRGSAISSRTA